MVLHDAPYPRRASRVRTGQAHECDGSQVPTGPAHGKGACGATMAAWHITAAGFGTRFQLVGGSGCNSVDPREGAVRMWIGCLRPRLAPGCGCRAATRGAGTRWARCGLQRTAGGCAAKLRPPQFGA
jgi:hypothetical protein